MSQYPQPPSSPPPGYGAPPPGGGFGGPPPGGYGAPPPPGGPYGGFPQPGQPKQSNGFAIGSLVCGLLSFCVPFLMGIVALILGFVGIRKASDPRVGGKGMAIAGIVLGLLGIGMWALFGGGIYALIKGTQPQRDVARQVITDLSAGNVEAAAANTDPAEMTREELESLAKQLQGYGTLTDTTGLGVNATPGQTEVVIIAQYGQGAQRGFEVTVKKGADGKYKVTDLRPQGP